MNPVFHGRRRALISSVLLCSGLVASLPQAVHAAVTRDFEPRFSVNAPGAIVVTGAPLLTCPTELANCAAALSGVDARRNNNEFAMRFIDADDNPATFNSSSTILTLADTATVAWAGLYWGADTSAGRRGAAAPDPSAIDTVRFRAPGATGYTKVAADHVDTSDVAGGVRYQGIADVTDMVRAAGDGEYSVADVQAGTGEDRYGGWSLVVAFLDAGEPVRNLTIFDGYAVVRRSPSSDQRVSLDVSGFLTPLTGPVRTDVSVVTYEGDRGLLGDDLRLGGSVLADELGEDHNFFNGTRSGVRTAGADTIPNAMSFDIDHVAIDGLLANGASSTAIEFTTDNDTYFPGVVAFQTELYAPRLDLALDVDDVNGGDVEIGDRLDYRLAMSNNGRDAATAVELGDLVPVGTELVPGSVTVSASEPFEMRVAGDVGSEMGPVVDRAMSVGAAATVGYRVVVRDDAGTSVDAVAGADYVAATSQLDMEATSNEVTLPVVRPITVVDPPPTTVPPTTEPPTTTADDDGADRRRCRRRASRP